RIGRVARARLRRTRVHGVVTNLIVWTSVECQRATFLSSRAAACATMPTVAFENLQPLALETAPERIADQVRASVLDGSLAPGTQLTEVQLAERLGVSRGPVREAMQRLIQEGLLRAERHRGVFVMELD